MLVTARHALCLGGGQELWCDLHDVVELTGVPAVEYLHGPAYVEDGEPVPCPRHGLLSHRVPRWPGMVVACNAAGVHWPLFLDHWATMHPEFFRHINGEPGWEEQRRERGHHPGYARWAKRSPDLVDRIVTPWAGGSSGLLMLTVAQAVGATHAILCGVPMTVAPHFDEHHRCSREDWKAALHHRRAWERPEIRQRFEAWTRSMSGWTREAFGAPTREWLT